MSKNQSTHIYYFICQDKDNSEQPNFFTIPINKNAIKLVHIVQYFPLKGTYIFRFKFAHEGFIVWLDINDADMRVPTFKEKIYVKVNRISWSEDKNSHLVRSNSSKIPEVKQEKKEQFNIFDHHQQKPSIKTPSPAYNSPQMIKNSQNNLLGGFGLSNFSATSAISATSANQINLLGEFNSNPPSKAKQQINLGSVPTKHGDLI